MKTVARAAEIAERLNKVRLARTLALLSPLQRQLFRLIPLFFHHHARHGFNLPQFFSLQRLAGRLQVIPFGLLAAEQDIAF